jgi:hypothetical protein
MKEALQGQLFELAGQPVHVSVYHNKKELPFTIDEKGTRNLKVKPDWNIEIKIQNNSEKLLHIDCYENQEDGRYTQPFREEKLPDGEELTLEGSIPEDCSFLVCAFRSNQDTLEAEISLNFTLTS